MAESNDQVEQKPFSAQVNFTFTAKDQEDADRLFERVCDFIGSIGGDGEGGHIHEIEPNEVIPGSPLDVALRAGSFDA